MAKIIFYPNPLNKSEFKETRCFTIDKAMKEFGIENKPLSVFINGKCPDEISTSKLLMPWDKVEIFIPVHGSNNDWATIVTVIATVGALLTPVGWAAAAIAIGGALIAGALRANGPKPSHDRGATNAEEAVGLNSSSPQVAQNQIRPLEVMPIVMGSTRMAPDVMTDSLFGRPLEDTSAFGSYRWLKSSDQPDYIYHKVTTMKTAYVSSVVCYGFGDLDINSRKFGSYPIEEGLNINYDPINDHSYASGSTFGFSRQSVKSLEARVMYAVEDNIIYNDEPEFDILHPVMSVKASQKPSVQFSNTIDNILLIPPEDLDLKSWSYYEGGAGEDSFRFSLTGQLYANNPANGQVIGNTTAIQMQYKLDYETEWRVLDPEYKDIYNDGLSEIYTTFTFNYSADTGLYMTDKDILCIRIRKAVNDSIDNTSHKVARLSIVDTFFYTSLFLNADFNTTLGQTVMGINTEGFYITNNLSLDGQANNYSAIVEGKCFVFENDQWVWKHSRNPAWWFLFFARGGFKNLSSTKDQLWPYSPTLYWQNYVTHPSNTEIMFGCGYENDKIDIEKIKEWAMFCDDNELQINIVIRDEASASETLERIANVGRASVTYDTGKLSVIYEDKNQLPVTMFGMANIIAGSFNASYASKIEVGKIVAKFSNRVLDFAIDQIEVQVPFSDPNSLIIREVSLEGVTELTQAGKEARLLAARQFFQSRNYEWKTDHEGFIARRGDLVYLSHDSTQFGYSGRIVEFIFEDNLIKGFKASSNVDSSVKWVMIRLPNGDMNKYRCEFVDGLIYFIDTFDISDGPEIIKNQRRDFKNTESRFPRSIADDFIFIADIKETTGKIVRISSVESHEDHSFTYTAIDEDPALWAFEIGVNENPESTDDSIGIIEAINAQSINLGNGSVKLSWDGSDDCLFMVIDDENNQPMEVNGRFSFGDKEVTLNLVPEKKYTFKILPISISSNIVSRSVTITVWPE